jgi:hypothetical protein
MLTVTIQFSDVAAARAALTRLLDGSPGVVSYTVPTPAPAVALTLVQSDGPATEAPGKPEATPAPAARRVRSQPTAEAGPSPAADAPVPATEKPAAQPSTAQAAAASSADEKPAGVQYADLQAAVIKLCQIDKSRALPIAQGLGAATFKLLPMDKWAEALAKVNATIAELQG